MNSKSRRALERSSLDQKANELAQEMSVGQWSHVPNLSSTPIEELKEILNELEARCPGHTINEYEYALRRSIFFNR
jgi:hypothetical protein